VKYFKLALGFLTAIPISTDPPQPGDLGRAALWFPLVGLGLGAILASAFYGLSFLFQPLLVSALVVALWATLTGGLHLDGLADCCDGLFATATPERRLEIMRDPRLGSFGVIGLVLFFILKVLALTFATLDAPATHVLLMLFAPALARWLILPVALQPQARAGGLGADFASGLKPIILVLSALVPLALIIIGGPRFIIAALVACLSTGVIILIARSRLGGVTGDVFGLTVELAELAILLVFAVIIIPNVY
jgi:adenosylcobinamide-GDP ribazoletransferase